MSTSPERLLGPTRRSSRSSRTHLSIARIAPVVAALGLVGLADRRVLVALPIVVLVAHLAPQKKPSRVAELGIYAAAAGVIVLGARSGWEPRGGLPTAIALIAALFVVARVLFTPNLGPRGGDLGLVLLAATAIGAPPQRFVPFGPVATVLIGLAIAARGLTSNDVSLAAIRAAPKKRLAVLVFTGLAILCGVGAGRALPRLTYRYATRLAKLMWERPRAGFSDEISLSDGDGDVRKILESETVVLHVSGTSVDHLRGKIYETFDGKRWHGLSAIDPPRPEAPPLGARARTTTVEAVTPSRVYFAPIDLAVRNAPTRDGSIARGGLRSTWELYAAPPALPPPTSRDRVPSRVYTDEIRALAVEWTKGRPTDNDRLIAIEEHLLAGYRYTLAREPFTGSAIYDFLFVHHAGHCELFATAFALLARSVGIPTRMVGGYRVVEPGALGDSYVVRERHAHAWVEAFHGDAWHTWDPTPTTAFARRAPAWERALDALSQPRTEAALGAGALVVALALFARAIIKRRRARNVTALATVSLHPELVKLEACLATEGIVRARSEGLFTFASRLDAHGDSLAAEAVRACARLCYGREGTDETLAERVSARVDAPRPAVRTDT